MSGLTPLHSLPYPTNGDPIHKGAEQIEALARAVDAKLGTGGGGTGTPGPPGPPGPAGTLSAEQATALFGSATATKKAVGRLVWSGPDYSPNSGFTRLRNVGDGRLIVHQDTGGVAYTTSDAPRLVAPIDGFYSVFARQSFRNVNGVKGVGLGTSSTDPMVGMCVWADIPNGEFVSASATTFLTAGTTLYPWIFAGVGDSNMTGKSRGMTSEFVLALIGGY